MPSIFLHVLLVVFLLIGVGYGIRQHRQWQEMRLYFLVQIAKRKKALHEAYELIDEKDTIIEGISAKLETTLMQHNVSVEEVNRELDNFI